MEVDCDNADVKNFYFILYILYIMFNFLNIKKDISK